jgi:hypothetical protein
MSSVYLIVRHVLVIQVRRVLSVERYRAPYPSLPDAGAIPGPDTLRQGANFAGMGLSWVYTNAIGSNDTNDGTRP